MPSAGSVDDARVDYTSLLDGEDRARRFSEDVVDIDLKDSVKLQKLYRQIQRQDHCQRGKVANCPIFYIYNIIIIIYVKKKLLFQFSIVFIFIKTQIRGGEKKIIIFCRQIAKAAF